MSIASGLIRSARIARVCMLCALWAWLGLGFTACTDDASSGNIAGTDTATSPDTQQDADPTDDASTTEDGATSTTTDGTSTSPDAEADTQPDTASGCVTDCDCPQGEACLADGSCIATAQPTYCCENAGCPQGAACKDSQGAASTCAGCRSNCECPQGEACLADGSCIATAQPTYCCDNAGCPAGEACLDAQGATGACPACVSACDCPQGQACTANGACIATAQPTYCCENPGCPQGEACATAAGGADVCAGDVPPGPCSSHCDCPQGKDCANGACVDGIVPTYCCDNAGCPANQVCRDAGGGFGQCPRQACTKSCDCDQGQTCNNGECRRGFTQTYCCDKVGCPGGESCVDSQSQVGVCPVVATSCTSTADCAPRGADWVCDTASSRCYQPGRCSSGDTTVAPCVSGTCNFLNVCECDPQDPAACRDGEQCTTITPQLPSACTAF
jgi:hypothetical protein